MSSTFEFDPDRMEGSGLITRGTAGENLAAHRLVYQGTNSRWYLADADAAATMPVIGLTLYFINSGQNGQILLQGYIGDSSWSYLVGREMYASTTPGLLTQTPPGGIGDLVQVVGIATDDHQLPTNLTKIIYFDPLPPSGGVGAGGGEAEWYPAPNPDAEVGDHTAMQMLDGVDTYIHNEVYIPRDFHNLIVCHVIVSQGTAATPNMVWTCDTDWGQICVGEDYLANTDNTGGTTQLPQDDLVCLDISAALTGVAAEDLVGVSFMRDGNAGADTVGGPVFYFGIRLRYT